MSSKVNKKYPPQNNGYDRLRARLIAKGTNINRWAAERGYPFTTVYDSARELRKGIISTRIKRELEEFANG